MGKKDKKKGKGAEKTARKTEKKMLNKIKKEMAASGETEITNLFANIQERDRKTAINGEVSSSEPSPRYGFTFCPHPNKDELVLFGGEHYVGKETTMFNDLFFYNIKKNQWSKYEGPVKPLPRSSHQAVTVSQRGGEMWVFGGEFGSPCRSYFHHFRDLWVFHFSENRWEEVKASGAPSSRSGHRMVVCQKKIFIFGGFHETVNAYKYYNDIYAFDLDTFVWTKIEAIGKVPAFRSAGVFVSVSDDKMLLYGGYSREKVKKDVDKGIMFTDMYYLQADNSTKTKWKWVQVKPFGVLPPPLGGIAFARLNNKRVYIFGGVQDDETDEESMQSTFYNDLYALELENGRWVHITLRGKDVGLVKKRRRRAKDLESMDGEESDESEEVVESVVHATLAEEVVMAEDDIFTVKIGPSISSSPAIAGSSASAMSATPSSEAFVPRVRMAAGLCVKNGILYLYGGRIEDGEKSYIYSDFYSLDTHKLDEWRTIIPFSESCLVWIESEESESEGSDSDNSDMSDDYDGGDDLESEEEMDTL